MRAFFARFDVHVSAVYAIVATLWIALSDTLVGVLVGGSQALITSINIVKGLGFVIVTTLAVFAVLSFELRKRNRVEQSLQHDIAERKRAEEAVRESKQRYQHTLDSMLEGCQIIGPDWRYLYINDSAAFHGRQPKEALLGHTMMEMYPGIEATPVFSTLRRCMEARTVEQVENEFTYPDGDKAWFELRIQPVPEGIFILSLDITERRKAEERIRQLNRTLSVLSDVNQAIVRIREIPTLFERICQIAVDKGNFRMAWIGMLNVESGQVKPVVHAGIAEDYLDKFVVVLNSTPQGDSVTASAIRTGKRTICNDVEQLGLLTPRREYALQLGYRSVAAFPLSVGGEVRGAITLYAGKVDFFSEEELILLDEMAGDISFSMEYAEKETQRQQAEASVSRYAQQLEILHEIDQGIIQGESTPTLVERTLKHVRELIPCRRATIALIDHAANDMVIYAGDFDHNSELVKGYRAPVPMGWPEGYDTEPTRLSDDLRLLPNPNQSYLAAIKEGTLSTLSTLLTTQGQSIGVFYLSAEAPGFFTPEHREITKQIGSQLAIAVRQAHLSEELARHMTELEQRVVERTAELQAAKERVEAILNNSTDGILLVHGDLSIQQANASFNALFACAPDDYFGTALTALVHEDDGDQVVATIQSVLTERRGKSTEIRARGKDGMVFDAELSVGYVKADGLVCTIRDITERKSAERVMNLKMLEEREFQRYLQGLQEVTMELTQINDLDEFYKRAVELGRERLGFERLALLLYDYETNLAAGTYGTDAHGNLTDERHLRFEPTREGIMMRALQRSERFAHDEPVTLFTALEPVSTGWNAAAVLWNGHEGLGWLVADNALQHKSASKPLLDILSLYALALGTLLAQKIVQAALRDSEARYRLLADNITDMVSRTTSTGEILYVSPSCRALLGYEIEELVGQSVFEFIHPTDLAYLDRAFAEIVKYGDVYDHTYRCRRKDGRYIWVETVGRVIRASETEAILGYISSSRDVTERTEAETALQAYAAEVSDLYNNAPTGYHSVDKDGIFVQMNDTELRWLGYTREEVIGKLSITDVLTPQSIAKFRINFPIFITRGSVNDLEFDFIRKDGSQFTGIVNATAITDDDGQFVMSRSTLFDITELKKTQEDLRESEARFRMLVEAAPIAIVISNQDGVITLVNEQAEQLFGYPREELIGQSVELLVPEHARDKHTQLRNQYQAAPHIRHMRMGLNLSARHKAGRQIPVDIELSYVETKDELLVMSFVIDVTEQKKAEEALRQALAKEKELGELKSRFVSMASHEFRTPLASILALSETLSAYRHKLTDRQVAERLEKIQEQVGHLQDIMEDVLQLARMQARRVEFNPSRVDLDALCRSVLDEFQGQPNVKHQLVYQHEGTGHEVVLDKKLIRQILTNLVSNAIKYSPADRPILISLERSVDTLSLHIHDEGIGIPEADMSHLFEPFHRAANVGTISGTGLGLVIAKESAELHGGTITVQSRVGVGTTFTVSIPIPENDQKNPTDS